jgi:putative IMPACT (imprinted ancient) family translation regulator
VTRYFGGVLLGTGGLLRAYTRSTADALDAAGVSAVRRWVEAELPCSYAQLEKMKQEAQAAGGVVEGVEYGANVTLRVLVPEKQSAAFAGQIFDQSNGSVTVRVTGESFRAVPLR